MSNPIKKESNDSQQSRVSRQAFNGNPEIDYSKQILNDEKKKFEIFISTTIMIIFM
jgi:hypothetical protein